MYNVLVVEDDSALRNNLTEFLQAEGYKTLTASNGLEAKTITQNINPDLIICDIMMPIMNGIQLKEYFNSKDELKSIPFIFLTAKSELQDIRTGMNSGADDYLIKPFKFDDLLHSINTRFEKKERMFKCLNEIKDTVTIYLPHELRTPLFSINGFADILSQEIDNLSKDEILDFVNNIKSAGMRLKSRIEKFLLFTEINNNLDNKINCIKPIQDVSQICYENLYELIYKNDNNRNRFNDITIFPFPPANLFIYQSYFNFIFSELIENAVKFSKEGTQITINGLLEDDYFKLSVRDCGCGMSNNEINSIREFKQFNKNDMLQEGLGFGLIIIKKIIELYDGKLEIESELGKSTSVSISIKLNKSN